MQFLSTITEEFQIIVHGWNLKHQLNSDHSLLFTEQEIYILSAVSAWLPQIDFRLVLGCIIWNKISQSKCCGIYISQNFLCVCVEIREGEKKNTFAATGLQKSRLDS